ncbi:hypothetical protein [Ureibacillus aquaedulcis]|uniref:Uncharacterized protein n=1 Tax=Ureibacillus aquaedulcis TaxID=3058421 RepID=A0ABT8GTJ9_9BACL|nr:hypothetical protein [Ureibacillus sp. BA0131]MDN4494735.1 hypothetical protein [Ureibacillus sp. BA0131]
MVNFQSFRGRVTQIQDFMIGQNGEAAGCYKLMTVEDMQGGIVNFVVSPDTYFVYAEIVNPGDIVTGYYDGDAPVILIYPPQYRALIVVKENPFENVKVDFFDSQFVSRDGQLKLNLAPNTPVLLRNWQPFSQNPANHNLIVIYSTSTRSIPAQTTPSEVIVWC